MFECKINENINGFDIKVFELDTQHSETLKTKIKEKIKKIKIYSEASHIDLLPPGMDEAFKERFRQNIQNTIRPKDHGMPWFNVRRAHATEFMSQLLLEEEYSCIFHEVSDKKINVSPVEIDKPISGIDVVGIQENDEYKFVVCEVKASKDNRIPCPSAKDLLEDIEKALMDEKRVSKEILQYMIGLADAGQQELEKMIDFLVTLLSLESSKNTMYEKIAFFPFMIRNNQKIIDEIDVGDLSIFQKTELGNIDLSGVIWSFNEDIDDFCIKLYNEALDEMNDVS